MGDKAAAAESVSKGVQGRPCLVIETIWLSGVQPTSFRRARLKKKKKMKALFDANFREHSLIAGVTRRALHRRLAYHASRPTVH